jgi:hypothetical protein
VKWSSLAIVIFPASGYETAVAVVRVQSAE